MMSSLRSKTATEPNKKNSITIHSDRTTKRIAKFSEINELPYFSYFQGEGRPRKANQRKTSEAFSDEKRVQAASLTLTVPGYC